jgi:trans-2,3-dihydro-3-hydroxyanthranilate isomerase
VSVDFVQVDVFADAPFEGNALAVFPDAAGLARAQMQAIAREMNLSETTFASSVEEDSYRVRIFTPDEEMAFAGHPTIGTCWVLRHLGRLTGDDFLQHSEAGVTKVTAEGERLWFERTGGSEDDLEARDPGHRSRIAKALAIEEGRVGLEARELGRPGRLAPAFADAGLRQLIVPLRDVDALIACRPRPELIAGLAALGVYCFTATQAGRVRARGFFPGVGVAEDPATGSSAAALGLYLAARLGAIDLEVRQGAEIGRPSRIQVDAEPGRVRVGGLCHLVLRGTLETLP